MFAGARRNGGGELVRIGAKADDSPAPRRRAARVVFPIAIGAVVLAAVIVLVRASFDTDEPGQARSALAARRASQASSSSSSSRVPAQAVGGPAAASRESAAGPASPQGAPAGAASPGAPAGGAATGAGPADSPAREVPPGEARSAAGPGPAGNPPGSRSGLHPGAGLAGREAARAGGVAGRSGAASTTSGAGGGGGARAAEPKLALVAEPNRRDAPWRRPPEEDASSKLVARFAPSGGATLRGRVVDAESGRPSIGVGIEAHIGDAFMRTVSDNAGAFKMSGMLPGRRITVWIIGRTDTFVAERIDVTSPGEGETADAGVVRLLRGDELAAHLEGWMGMFVSRRGRRNVVAAVSPWSPADRAGIQVGDVLLSIEGRDVDGLGPRATGFLLRGPVGTRANVAIQSRDGAVQRYQLERVLR